MPRMTAKYKAAITKAHNYRLPVVETKDQEELYTLLQDNGWFWNSKTQAWELHDIEEAEEPTSLIMVQAWNCRIYGQLLDPKDGRGKSYRKFGRWYSVYCPDGETGYNHCQTFLRVLTEAEFNAACEEGWL